MDLTHDIYLIYLELFRLDLRGNKGNSQYLSLIKSLKDKIDEEKELYELLAQNRDSFNKLLNYVKNKPTQILFLRMYGYMVFNEEDDSIREEVDDEDYKFRRLYSACNNDLFLVYLSFFQDYIEDNGYVTIRDGLIYTKYYNSFINPDLEEYLIDKKFEVSKINYARSYFVSSILLMDEQVTLDAILEGYKDAIAVAMASLLNIEDDSYNDEDRMVDIISSQCMLRAGLSMLSNKQYESLKDGIYRVLNELSTGENNISVSIVNSIITDRVKDKIRARRIFTNHCV